MTASRFLFNVNLIIHAEFPRECDEYLFGDYFCIVEWPDLIKPLLKEQEFVELCIEVQNPELRVFHLKK